MKKASIFVVVLLIAVAIYGYVKKSSPESITNDFKDSVEKVSEVSEEMGGVFDFSKPMECTYETKDEEGNIVESKVYIDGEKYRSEFSAGGVKYYSISDGETMYTWSNESKEGTKMDIDCMNNLGGEVIKEDSAEASSSNYETSQDLLEAAMGVDCKDAKSVDVSTPKDINFIDQCEMLKQQMEMIKSYQNQMPPMEGLEIPQI